MLNQTKIQDIFLRANNLKWKKNWKKKDKNNSKKNEGERERETKESSMIRGHSWGTIGWDSWDELARLRFSLTKSIEMMTLNETATMGKVELTSSQETLRTHDDPQQLLADW